MKVAVLAANGKAAKKIIAEALERNLDVTAFARSENTSKATTFVHKDILDITKADLEGFDVVVDAVGGWTADTVGVVPAVVKHLATLLEGSNTRVLVVGGAGSLYVNPEHTVTVDMDKNFPQAWLPISHAHGDALKFLRNSKNLKWTYISPAADFQAEGERSGEYTLAGEEFTLNSKGESTISYADMQ